jgi:hypothetical protein
LIGNQRTGSFRIQVIYSSDAAFVKEFVHA